MKQRLLSLRKADYIPAPYLGENRTGIEPIGDFVLIRPDIASRKIGDIEMPDEVVDRAQQAATRGTIIEVGDGAFVWNGDRTRPWTGYKPKAGDNVCYTRYSGYIEEGDDGIEYRLMEDKCIGAKRKIKS
jgi:co-chaperonin GroES (HSP10)